MLTYLNELKKQKDLAEKEDAYKVRGVPAIVEIYDEVKSQKREKCWWDKPSARSCF